MVAYPRAQTVATFIVCTVVVLGAAFYVYGDSFITKNTLETPTITAHVSDSSINDLYIDTADWKKTFFSVNEANNKNFSTDNAKDISSNIQKFDLTATDLFGREFFSKFMTLRQAGLITNPDATKALVNQIVEDTQLITDEAKTSTIDDLFVSMIENTASLQVYANTVAHILKHDRPTGSEVLIAKKALETGNTNLLHDIDPIIAAYARVREELLTTSVPFSASTYHIRLINGISQALANAVALRNSASDPLQALNAISNHQETVGTFFYTVVDLRQYFNDYGIVFDPTEEAYSVFTLK